MKTALITIFGSAAVALHASALTYEKDILPIFEEHCHSCHGNGKTKGSVNLDPEHMHRIIGKSPRHIRPGDHTKSVLWEVINYPDDYDTRMPPPDRGPALSAAHKKKIKEWIDAGAPVEAMGTTAVTKKAGEKPSPLKTTLTNKDGKTINATVLKVEDGKAVLQLPNGKTYHYPLADLDEASREKLKPLIPED